MEFGADRPSVSTPSCDYSFSNALNVTRWILPHSEESFRRPRASNNSIRAVGPHQPLELWAFLFQEVLRLWNDGCSSSPLPVRISRDFPLGNPLAVKGDALIHGPSLVARSVGSEWRTRRPHDKNIQTNQLTGDQTT